MDMASKLFAFTFTGYTPHQLLFASPPRDSQVPFIVEHAKEFPVVKQWVQNR